MFIDHLPREAQNRDYVILSPQHGFGAITLPLLTRKLTTLDLSIRLDRWESILRIYLENGEIFPDPDLDRHHVLHVTEVKGEFLDQDGRKTGRFVDTSFHLIMSVPDANTIAGSLRMWDQQEISTFPNPQKEKQ